jgi:hypothetical protein
MKFDTASLQQELSNEFNVGSFGIKSLLHMKLKSKIF